MIIYLINLVTQIFLFRIQDIAIKLQMHHLNYLEEDELS